MRDPTQRASGAWPGDRRVHWRGVARGLAWFVVGWVALIVQLAMTLPIYAVGSAIGGIGGVLLALTWGGLTLFAAWSWVRGRWRVVVAPILTAALIVAGLWLYQGRT